MDKQNKWSWIGFVASYPPRECGIATFTKDITTAMDKKFNPRLKSKIIAINENSSSVYNYDKKVRFQIDETELESYYDAAAFINGSNIIKLVNIQHEFGLFGGKHGDYIIPFLERIKKPVVTTFHSVQDNPSAHRRKIVREICKHSKAVIVIIERAKEILKKDYGINENKITVIPHGIHPVPFTNSCKTKELFGVKNRIILSTFGLLGPRKSLEHVIGALPAIIKKYPNLLYVIIGETHPKERIKEGEKYRNMLIKKVKKMGLKKNVKFYNKYLPLKELINCLQGSDIYITPYLDKKQVSSGTLAYAFGCGKVCISTPYYYAQDILGNERGFLVDFKDSKAIADTIIHILNNPELKKSMEKKAYEYSRIMTWPNVAEKYLEVFNKVLRE